MSSWLIERPDVQRQRADPMLRADPAHCLDEGTTNPALSARRRYADVVKVDHRVRVAQRCLWPPDDLRIDITGWLGAEPGEKHNVFGLGKQLADSRWRKALRPGKLEQPWQPRGVHALHLAIESRDGFGIYFSCRRDHNFHGHDRLNLCRPKLADELSHTAVLVENICARTSLMRQLVVHWPGPLWSIAMPA